MGTIVPRRVKQRKTVPAAGRDSFGACRMGVESKSSPAAPDLGHARGYTSPCIDSLGDEGLQPIASPREDSRGSSSSGVKTPKRKAAEASLDDRTSEDSVEQKRARSGDAAEVIPACNLDCGRA